MMIRKSVRPQSIPVHEKLIEVVAATWPGERKVQKDFLYSIASTCVYEFELQLLHHVFHFADFFFPQDRTARDVG